MTYGLLNGLRVLEFGEFISAPYCGKLLADMGADVVKIERAGTGDWARDYGPWPVVRQAHHERSYHRERSGLFLYLNADKRSVTLNLETPTGREILAGMVSRADVLVHNLHPTEMDRVDLNYEALNPHNAGLVMASITPFGLTGPYRNWKAYDINLAAGGGISEGLGSPDREPLTFGTPEVGYFAGAAAACSIVMALLERDTPSPLPAGEGWGEGESSRCPLWPAHRHRRDRVHGRAVQWPRGPDGGLPVACNSTYRPPRARLSLPQLHPALQGRVHFRRLSRGPAVAAPSGADGQPRVVAGAPPPQPYCHEQRIRRRGGRLRRGVAAAAHQVGAAGNGPGAPHPPGAGARLRRGARRPQPGVTLFVEVERPDTGPVSTPGPPYALSGAEVSQPRPAPTLGQHNSDIYAGELGYTPEEVVQLYRLGII